MAVNCQLSKSVLQPPLWLCMIWGFHGSDYEECHILGCYATWRNIPEDGILHHYGYIHTAETQNYSLHIGIPAFFSSM
jgi:hypothetical protein